MVCFILLWTVGVWVTGASRLRNEAERVKWGCRGWALSRAAVWRIPRDVSVRARTEARMRASSASRASPSRPARRRHPRPPLLGRRVSPAPARPPAVTFAYPRRSNKINFPLKVRVGLHWTWTEITFSDIAHDAFSVFSFFSDVLSSGKLYGVVRKTHLNYNFINLIKQL